jgi:hypothetical protein
MAGMTALFPGIGLKPWAEHPKRSWPFMRGSPGWNKHRPDNKYLRQTMRLHSLVALPAMLLGLS